MKYYIFRKDWNGFMDWIASIRHFRWTIRAHEDGAKKGFASCKALSFFLSLLSRKSFQVKLKKVSK